MSFLSLGGILGSVVGRIAGTLFGGPIGGSILSTAGGLLGGQLGSSGKARINLNNGKWEVTALPNVTNGREKKALQRQLNQERRERIAVTGENEAKIYVVRDPKTKNFVSAQRIAQTPEERAQAKAAKQAEQKAARAAFIEQRDAARTAKAQARLLRKTHGGGVS